MWWGRGLALFLQWLGCRAVWDDQPVRPLALFLKEVYLMDPTDLWVGGGRELQAGGGILQN